MLDTHVKESDILKLKEKSTKPLLKSKDKKEHDEHNIQTHTVQQRKFTRQKAEKKKCQPQTNKIVKVHTQKRTNTSKNIYSSYKQKMIAA